MKHHLEDIFKNIFTLNIAKKLLKLSTEEEINQMLNLIIEKKLNVSQTEELIEKHLQEKSLKKNSFQ